MKAFRLKRIIAALHRGVAETRRKRGERRRVWILRAVRGFGTLRGSAAEEAESAGEG
jgi:hypothetical protein